MARLGALKRRIDALEGGAGGALPTDRIIVRELATVPDEEAWKPSPGHVAWREEGGDVIEVIDVREYLAELKAKKEGEGKPGGEGR